MHGFHFPSLASLDNASSTCGPSFALPCLSAAQSPPLPLAPPPPSPTQEIGASSEGDGEGRLESAGSFSLLSDEARLMHLLSHALHASLRFATLKKPK